MTDAGQDISIKQAVEARLKKRHRAEQRFRLYGLSAILVALAALATLIGSIAIQAAPAFTTWEITLDVDLDASRAAPGVGQARPGSPEFEAAVRRGSYAGLMQDAMRSRFPQIEERSQLRELFKLYTSVSSAGLMNRVLDNPSILGRQVNHTIPVSDDVDRYLKGQVTAIDRVRNAGAAQLTVAEDGAASLRLNAALVNAIQSEAGDEGFEFGLDDPSVIVRFANGAARITGLQGDAAQAEILTPFDADAGEASLLVLETPEANRLISDAQIVWTETLRDAGVIKRGFNTYLFTNTDSREPELAGVLGALVGSVLTMLVTMFMAVPVGVFTAIYLEEYAPRTRWTDLIEVNINNLAAVPSIVFGLLGLAVFINFFGMPRSAPLVGGMVLALMTLPTVIISSRAALKAVPPSIREAALGVGASRTQTVFSHVLPLAMPGIMTGSIIGLAQALGETAPLLMIGMVAFVADTPNTFTDPSTVMPVQIYMWALNPERAWEARSAAAIIVLLSLMIVMNAIAVLLRRRFERRW